MKVKISFTVNVSDEFRCALNNCYGLKGLATRDFIKNWYYNNSLSVDDDLMFDYQLEERRAKTRDTR